MRRDFKAGQLPSGPPGAQGAPATRFFAHIHGGDGAREYSSGVTASARTSAGFYTVTFERSVVGCAPLATPGRIPSLEPTDVGQAGSRITFEAGATDNVLQVITRASAGTAADRSFSVALFC